MSDEPAYFRKRVTRTVLIYNPDFGDSRLCASPECQHPYSRHFDPYEDWAAVGCKYCPCDRFKTSKKLTCQ